MVVHTYNPSTQEAEAGGLRVQGQSAYIDRSLLRNKNKVEMNRQFKIKYW
jgi:hypothetical protein